ncbi:MAG: M23 family metallopeptidase [Bdellovibrionales bacterium]|nr:M23 family metallopeptidase [Bdellovibrionales bacterium]
MHFQNYAEDIFLFLGILAGLCILCFFPSYEIEKVEFVNAPGLPPLLELHPGQLYLKDYPTDAKNLQLNNSALTPLPQSQKLFFIAGIYGGTTKLLHGELVKAKHFFEGLLTHPTRKVFRTYIKIKTDSVDSGNELRLPANVQKRLKQVDDQKKIIDRNRLITALNSEISSEEISCWKKPINSRVTSYFGRPRTLPSGRSYYHSGVDLRASVGVPIFNANEGTVVFADHMTVAGNNVIVSHGQGLFSRYMHLEKIKVALGDHIPTGHLIGLAGATGRVEAPHLHWEVIWKGNHADPLRFLQDWAQICGPE